mmetsp:Transcript_22078/g.63293  ORF Transcript_22078/g.63293 Transcript_22078/m.63293 type:complete len:270 (+) Transcript_22078:39-848(+)
MPAAASSAAATTPAVPQQPPPVDPQTIQERLLTREGGGVVARGSLLKCSHRYREYLQLVLAASASPSGATAEQKTEIRTAKESLQRELRLHALEMRKITLVADAAHNELAQYEEATRQIDADVSATRAEIDRLQTELTYEKKVRQNREEYESLAKMANVRPARRQTEEKLRQVQEEMSRIAEEEAANIAELEVRSKQFHLLMQTVNDLKSTIAEDETRKRVLEEAADEEGGGDGMAEDGEVADDAAAAEADGKAHGLGEAVEAMDFDTI